MYKNIVVPIDLANAERGKAMITTAKTLCDKGGKITLVTVLDQIPGYVLTEMPSGIAEKRGEEAKSDLEAIANAAGGKLGVEVQSGKPASEIIDTAKQIGADLIIVASHNPGMQDYFLGSTAARVVRHAPCSVLVDR